MTFASDLGHTTSRENLGCCGQELGRFHGEAARELQMLAKSAFAHQAGGFAGAWFGGLRCLPGVGGFGGWGWGLGVAEAYTFT